MQTIRYHITNLNSIFYRVKSILSGKYVAGSMVDDKGYYDLNVPTVHDDKKNLKADMKSVGKDLSKAVSQKQKELSL